MPPNPKQLPPDSATILERSRGVFFAQWEELLRLRRAVLKTSDLDDIHDLRVASRRFRAALELYYPFAPESAKTELRKSVCKLTRVLGGLRNIDEARLFIQSQVKTDTTDDITINLALSGLRSRELKRIKKALTSFDHRTLGRMVREMIAGMNEESITARNRFSLLAYFSEVSIRQYMTIHRSLAGSTVSGHRLARHSLRIAIKKWRYFLEIVTQVLNCDYTHILDLLKEYQSLLGRMNDIVEFEGLFRSLDLPRNEQDQIEAILQAEDAIVLQSFTELIEQKPLHYAFLV